MQKSANWRGGVSFKQVKTNLALINLNISYIFSNPHV